jgi:ATP diphosphatase
VTNDDGKKTITDLVAVMAALRTPLTGCPWDLAQDFATIAPYTVEEAYEVADAIERRDMADLEEELGDLLLQVVYHARMAEEAGHFAFADVVDGITRKMIRRHPHVFGDAAARTPGDVDDLWARIKVEEKSAKAARKTALGVAHAQNTASVLDGVPLTQPALVRAIKLQDKAAKVGFDWPSIGPVFAKLREELVELEEVATALDPRGAAAVSRHDPAPGEMPGDGASPLPASIAGHEMAAVKEEFGDLLFVMANVARHLKLDAEDALRAANAKFTRRFRYIEARLAEDGRTPAESDLAEMDRLWDEVRAADKLRPKP